MTAPAASVLFELDGPVAHLRLNRPDAGNAVDEAAFGLLVQHLQDLHARKDVRAVVLSGAGTDFCLGRDRKPPQAPPSALTMREALRSIVRTNRLLATLPIPTIAAVQGKAAGMGAGLTVQCDLTIATENATFSFPEMHHDLPPTVVLSYLPRYLPPKRCYELVITGQSITAATALAWGLVNRIVPAGELLSQALSLAASLAAHSSVALATVKEYLLKSRGMSEEQAYELGINMLANVATSGQIGLYDRS